MERMVSRYVADRLAEAIRPQPLFTPFASVKALCERVTGKTFRSFERGEDGVYRATLEIEPALFTWTVHFSVEASDLTTERLP